MISGNLLAEIIEIAPQNDNTKERQTITAKVKKQILERDANCCRICSSTKSLKIHHIDPKGSSTQENLITLCGVCHEYVHKQLRVKGYRYYNPYGAY